MMRELTFMQTILSGIEINLSTTNNKNFLRVTDSFFVSQFPMFGILYLGLSGYNVLLVYVHKSFKISLESAEFLCETEAC